MLTLDKITEIFCITDDFCQNLAVEIAKQSKLPAEDGKKHRNRPCEMSDSEIITILIVSFLFFQNHYFNNYFDFKYSLEDIFGRKVDLLEEKPIQNKYLKQSIDNSKQLIYRHQN